MNTPLFKNPFSFYKGLGIGLVIALLVAVGPLQARAQSAETMAVLKGLSPMSVLPNTPEGKAALDANYKVTGGIQAGTMKQPTLLPFPLQQAQALQDAFITGGNDAQLADGLGTTLGSAYLARAHFIDGSHKTYFSDRVHRVMSFAEQFTGKDGGAGKYYFANGTTNGKTPVSDEALAYFKQIGGHFDVFGNTYGFPAGATGAGKYGNARPFQTEKSFQRFTAPDYLNVMATNEEYNHGLINSPSYPSGHTTYGYTGSLVLALLVPERYQQMMARGAEYGNDRIIMGAHYTMDVMGGRTLALYDMAHLLANDPMYLNDDSKKASPMLDFRAAILEAREDMKKTLEASCGNTIDVCAIQDIGRFNNPAANKAFCAWTQTYQLPVVYPKMAQQVEDVNKIAPEAGYLLTVAFPKLTLEQANQILTETEGPGGGFLDNGSAFGLYSRLDLYAAAGKAATFVAGK